MSSKFKIVPSNWESMTVAERVAAGLGSEAEIAIIQERERQHKEWLASPEGQKWLSTQSWYHPDKPKTQ
jgi:hypothetical protein